MTRTPLPDADHILRHVKPTAFDNGRVQGAAFGWMPKQPDDGLSVNWIEHADGDTQDEKIEFIRARRRLTWKKSHKLAILNVGRLRTDVRQKMEALGFDQCAEVVHDPLDATDQWPADPTHALIAGIPNNESPEAEAVFDSLAACVESHLPALTEA
jgi:hypothetical protein